MLNAIHIKIPARFLKDIDKHTLKFIQPQAREIAKTLLTQKNKVKAIAYLIGRLAT